MGIMIISRVSTSLQKCLLKLSGEIRGRCIPEDFTTDNEFLQQILQYDASQNSRFCNRKMANANTAFGPTRSSPCNSPLKNNSGSSEGSPWIRRLNNRRYQCSQGFSSYHQDRTHPLPQESVELSPNSLSAVLISTKSGYEEAKCCIIRTIYSSIHTPNLTPS